MTTTDRSDPDCLLRGCAVPPGRLLDLTDVVVHVRELPGPAAAPPVLLLHGLGATAAMNWFGAFAAFRGRNRVIAVDLPGHGRSSPSIAPDAMTGLADAVARVIEERHARGCVVVGYSLGGAVAQLLWRRHPDLVGGLVLAATARDFRGQPIDRLRFWGASNMLVRQVAHVFPASLHLPVHLVPGVDRGLLAWARTELATASSADVLTVTRSLAPFLRPREFGPAVRRAVETVELTADVARWNHVDGARRRSSVALPADRLDDPRPVAGGR